MFSDILNFFAGFFNFVVFIVEHVIFAFIRLFEAAPPVAIVLIYIIGVQWVRWTNQQRKQTRQRVPQNQKTEEIKNEQPLPFEVPKIEGSPQEDSQKIENETAQENSSTTMYDEIFVEEKRPADEINLPPYVAPSKMMHQEHHHSEEYLSDAEKISVDSSSKHEKEKIPKEILQRRAQKIRQGIVWAAILGTPKGKQIFNTQKKKRDF